MGYVKIEKNCSEADQEGSFMNATLQGAGDKIAFSIATYVSVPKNIYAKGENEVAAYLMQQLSAAADAASGLKFSVQIGTSYEHYHHASNEE